MYEQLRSQDIMSGGVYHCPPGGMVYICLNNLSTEDGGCLTWLVVESASLVWNVPGSVIKVRYPHGAFGPWTRIA